jgi:hypothetical protein
MAPVCVIRRALDSFSHRIQSRMGLDAAKFPVNFYTLFVQRKLRWLGHLLRSNALHGLSKFIPALYWGDMSPEDVAIMTNAFHLGQLWAITATSSGDISPQ